MNTKSIKNFMKNHSQNVMKKVVVCLSISLVLMMSSFSLCFADTIPTFPELPYYSSQPSRDNMLLSPWYRGTSSKYYYYASKTGDIIAFKYSTSSSDHYSCFFSSNSQAVLWFQSSGSSNPSELTLSYHNDIYNVYYLWTNNTNSDIESMGIFNNVDEALAYYFNNQTPPAKSYYTLQNGWLSVIDLGSSGSNYEFDLNTSFQMNSGLVSGTWGNGTTQRYWFSDSLPDENTSYLSTFGNAIEWEKGYPRNVFGQTKNATCTISGTSSGRYLYILNPALQQVADEQSPSINNMPMTISGLTNGMIANIYKLTASATINGLNNAVDIDTVGTVSATDSAADLTNSFINDDNDTVVQNAGGGNENEVAQSVNGYLQAIQNALDNFVNQFISLLSAPISHIQQMIESGSNFFNVFGQLFTWLPEEITVIITGSLLVMVIIGVFKMFL